MEHEGVPMTWITHRVRVELRDPFEEHTGRLRNVNALGIELEQHVGTAGETTLSFYPWSSVRRMTLLA